MNTIKDFELAVSEDIKNKVDRTTRDLLRLPENRVAFRDCLLSIIETVSDKIQVLENDIASLRATYSEFSVDPAAGLEEQRDKAARFRFHAEKRLAEVERLIQLNYPGDPMLSLAAFLKGAIENHRDSKGAVGDAYDLQLWSALDGEVG